MESFLTLFNILCVSVQLLVSFVQLALFVRAILSFFNPEEEGMLAAFLYAVTEPAILPVRSLLTHFHIGEDTPIDFSFLVTVLLLSVISAFLPAISI